MARQFKIEVAYPVVPTAVLYWHDNGTLEFITLPQLAASDLVALNTALIQAVVGFMKQYQVNSIEVSRLP